ncbi:unnamed protein product [Medioppia subpectinata]|uniref:Ketoreductase domain-containing protein n=1 Tax=Medioppia subpectinata TaxID=1979941 RepID=A0A7R9Q428_9ACAR|nr:unnamed protein product [Medioppia subpectinata]CAG2111936.1 unnamed protein product [Medioppia subpectinata]
MSVTYDFTGKVALITGSSGGIGAGIAVQLAQSGASVVVTGRNADKVAEVAKQCLNVSPKGVKPLEVLADVTKREDLRRLVDQTIGRFGKLDIVVNNAGALFFGTITDHNFYDNYAKTMSVNLDSVVYLTHICVEYLEKTNGNIINISSMASKRTVRNVSAYCMAKSALDMFGQCMAAELGPKRIRVNTINVGYIPTGIYESSGVSRDSVEAYTELYRQRLPVGREGRPIDVAQAVHFLASDHATFITGANLVIDGGDLAANTCLDHLS